MCQCVECEGEGAAFDSDGVTVVECGACGGLGYILADEPLSQEPGYAAEQARIAERVAAYTAAVERNERDAFVFTPRVMAEEAAIGRAMRSARW
jgi:hypothetical protein